MERKSSWVLDCLENTVQKRLHVKQSIDHVLNPLKACSPALAAEPVSPLPECTFYAPSASQPDTTANDETSTRRPSLPHIYDDLPVSSPSSSRRPRLAGKHTKPEPLRVSSVPRKIGSTQRPNGMSKLLKDLGCPSHLRFHHRHPP
jgi:hypothetical protein